MRLDLQVDLLRMDEPAMMRCLVKYTQPTTHPDGETPLTVLLVSQLICIRVT